MAAGSKRRSGCGWASLKNEPLVLPHITIELDQCQSALEGTPLSGGRFGGSARAVGAGRGCGDGAGGDVIKMAPQTGWVSFWIPQISMGARGIASLFNDATCLVTHILEIRSSDSKTFAYFTAGLLPFIG
jgi:hypothetical protein